jgi:hypothetical protein
MPDSGYPAPQFCGAQRHLREKRRRHLTGREFDTDQLVSIRRRETALGVGVQVGPVGAGVGVGPLLGTMAIITDIGVITDMQVIVA